MDSTQRGEPIFPVEGLLPKQATHADAFLRRFPQYDGRNVRVAVLDTGVDPAAIGLDGPNKVVDVIDCTGAGDVPLQVAEAREPADSAVAKDALELVSPGTGRSLLVPRSVRNPSGVWRVGTKRAYDLWPDSLVQRRAKERRAAFEVSHAALLNSAQAELAEFEAESSGADSDETARALRKEELEARVALLKDLLAKWEDPGPVLEAAVFHDGEHWRVLVGGAEGEAQAPGEGVPAAQQGAVVDLRSAPALTDFRTERQWACFGEMDLLTYTVNVLNDGELLSLVTLSGTHGTHVAGIIAARHEDPATDGVAPGAEIVSLKIGDARLSGMEQGQALLRAAQAILDTRCDVANMSFGEDGGFGVEDKGAFARVLRDLVIRERGVCFVSSAGNNGPALTTVGQPGGTTSGVLSAGAYVTAGAMQKAEYALVEQGVGSSVTTWCSRGPAADGDRGVSIYAPGAAITSICRYALQSTQLMNGTSMSSPNAAGCVALLVSAMKAEGIPVTPVRVYDALLATGADVGDELGVRMLDVERAWAYLVEQREHPAADAEFRVAVTPAGKPLGRLDQRGVYLRSAAQTQRTTQFSITVTPRFRAAETQRAFRLELRAVLAPSAPWVRAPEFLALGGNGRTFEARVEAAELPPGLHHASIDAFDAEQPGTKLFSVPVTVAKPVVPAAPTHRLERTRLAAGRIERQFVHVPEGTSWAEVRLRSANHEAAGTSVRFWLHLVQVLPQQRLSKVEHAFVMALNEGEPVQRRVDLRGGHTLEVCLAQFWSNRAGFDLELEFEFHGVQLGGSGVASAGAAGGASYATDEELALVGGEGLARLELSSPLRIEEVKPTLTLDARRSFVRPQESRLRPLRTPRERQPTGHQLNELVLEYPLAPKEATKLTWALPVSNNLYDNGLTLLTQLVDKHQRVVHFGDVYPKAVDVARGEYVLRAQLLHESAPVLERLRNLPLRVDQPLGKPKEVSLSVYRDQVDQYGGGAPVQLGGVKLHPGEHLAVCLDTNLEGEQLPADAAPGDLLLGSLAFAPAGKRRVRYVVPPAPAKKDDGRPDEEKPRLPELLAGLAKKVPEDAREAFLERLVREHPQELDVLVARLETLPAEAPEHVERTLQACAAIEALVDEQALRLWLGTKHVPAAEQSREERRTAKRMRAEKAALELALTRHAAALLLRGDTAQFEQVFQHSRQFMPDLGTASDAERLHSNLYVQWHMHHGRFAQALSAVRKQLEELGAGTAADLAELDKARALERELLAKLGWDVWASWAQRWGWLRKPHVPAPF